MKSLVSQSALSREVRSVSQSFVNRSTRHGSQPQIRYTRVVGKHSSLCRLIINLAGRKRWRERTRDNSHDEVNPTGGMDPSHRSVILGLLASIRASVASL
jgi:hypothetical protein